MNSKTFPWILVLILGTVIVAQNRARKGEKANNQTNVRSSTNQPNPKALKPMKGGKLATMRPDTLDDFADLPMSQNPSRTPLVDRKKGKERSKKNADRTQARRGKPNNSTTYEQKEEEESRTKMRPPTREDFMMAQPMQVLDRRPRNVANTNRLIGTPWDANSPGMVARYDRQSFLAQLEQAYMNSEDQEDQE